MDTKETTRKERCGELNVEMAIHVCRMMAELMGMLTEQDREDLAEVLQAMGQSAEESREGIETIREILTPKNGRVLPFFVTPDHRPPALDRWSSYTGGQVLKLRKEAGLTQDDLARKAGLQQSHISRIEKGEVSPTRQTLEKIAKALGRPVADFDPTE